MMGSTFFQDYNQNTPITSSWLNDVNGVTYAAAGGKRVAVSVPVAWVRFGVSGGVVTVGQSVGVASVVRTGIGVYVVTYAAALTNAQNCYQALMSSAGFTSFSAESAMSVTIDTTNTTNVPIDPSFCCVTVLGAN